MTTENNSIITDIRTLFDMLNDDEPKFSVYQKPADKFANYIFDKYLNKQDYNCPLCKTKLIDTRYYKIDNINSLDLGVICISNFKQLNLHIECFLKTDSFLLFLQNTTGAEMYTILTDIYMHKPKELITSNTNNNTYTTIDTRTNKHYIEITSVDDKIIENTFDITHVVIDDEMYDTLKLIAPTKKDTTITTKVSTNSGFTITNTKTNTKTKAIKYMEPKKENTEQDVLRMEKLFIYMAYNNTDQYIFKIKKIIIDIFQHYFNKVKHTKKKEIYKHCECCTQFSITISATYENMLIEMGQRLLEHQDCLVSSRTFFEFVNEKNYIVQY